MAASRDIHTEIDLCQKTAEDRSQPLGSTSQSSHPSTVQAGSTVSSQMLSIKLDKVPLLEHLREKVEKNYCVKIRKDMSSASDGKSASDTQWISILGSKGDCKNAGTYISALCNPVEWTVYDYDAPTLSDVFDEDTCQKIEDKSHAVLIRNTDRGLIIQGSDQLHVLLALSIVEDIAQRFATSVNESSSLNSSAMLDKMLQRAYSNDDEMEDDDGFDWSTMPEEVKRAVLVSLIDIDVTETAVVDVENVTDEQAVNKETVPVEVPTASVSSCTSSTSATTTASASNTSSVAVANEVVDLTFKLDFSDPSIQPLVIVALSKGYSQDEIENVLSETSQWKESAFLRALHTNRRIQTSQQSSVSKTFQHDIHMDVDEAQSVAAANDSVILLKSDQEIESTDDGDDELLEIEKQGSQTVSVDKQSLFTGSIAVLYGQAPTTAAAGPDACPGHKRKKKKRKKKKQSPVTVAHQEEKMPVIKTRTDISDLDSISLIPSASSAIADVSNDVMVVDDNSDSDVVEVQDSVASMKPVVNRKQRRAIAGQNEARSRSPHQQSRSTTSNTSEKGSQSNRGQLDLPEPASSSVPVVDAGFQKSPAKTVLDPGSLRYIVIDGSNVAMSHSNSKVFSCRGIKLVIDFFKRHGHSKVVALVPQWRHQAPTPEHPVSDHHLLERLKEQGTLAFTPSRRIGNRNISCYDDRFMLDLAIQTEGVIVTNDNYRDLYAEKSQYRVVIENRLLPYSFVDDFFMIPEDPLGQYGPRLDDFLRMPSSSSSELPRALSSQTNVPSRAGSSSLSDVNPWPTGPRGIPYGQNEPSWLGATRLPHPSSTLPYQQQQPRVQQWQPRQPSVPQWMQNSYQMPHQQLWPPPPRSAPAVRNIYPSSSATGTKLANTFTATRGSRGRGGQHGARLNAPTLGPRPMEKTREIRKQLLDVFPDNAEQVDSVLEQNQSIYSVDELCLKVSEIV